MTKRDSTLIAVVGVLIVASGILFYRAFNTAPVSLSPPTATTEDVGIRNQGDIIEARIKKAAQKIQPGGALDTLFESAQFQQLTTEWVKPISIGVPGRANPFIPFGAQGGQQAQ